MRVHLRAIGAVALLATMLAPAGLAAQETARTRPSQHNAPPAEMSPPPPIYTPPISAGALHDAYCGAQAIALADRRITVDRVAFTAEPGQPARLILCLDDAAMAQAIPIITIEQALAFLAYRPFAPFWPAAEARWGDDLSILREDVRRTPMWQGLANYAYARLMSDRSARAMAASRTAAGAGDYQQARDVVLRDLARLESMRQRAPEDFDDSFDMSLMITRIAYLDALRDGPSAGADSLRDLMARFPIDNDYSANPITNHAAFLAEAGRGEEALAVLSPLLEGWKRNQNDAENYKIPGSMREFSWIMACALHQTATPQAAAPFIALVNGQRRQPVDPYVQWTRSNSEIRLRMAKCMGDATGFADAMREDPPGVLSWAWLELQDESRAMIGTKLFDTATRRVLTAEVGGDYRQLPERYRPALKGWLDETAEP